MWTDAVREFESKIIAYIKQAKKEGTTGMAMGNLRQMVGTSGISLPNPNAYHRAFDAAVDNLRLKRKLNGFQIYG